MRKTPTVCPERSARPSQAGQASVLLLLILGTFLLGSIGFAVDLSNLWFHRQAAQSAADAACTAGAMDMLYLHEGTILTSTGFTVGTAGDCSSSSLAALCQYAGFNGYTATASAASWSSSTPANAIAVSWSFPSSVTGVTASGISNPFLNVVVQEKPASWFMKFVGVASMTVGASCTCGFASGVGSPPIVILNPTVPAALNLSGGTHIVIVGGPSNSIAVNSSANGSPRLAKFLQCGLLFWWQWLSHRHQRSRAVGDRRPADNCRRPGHQSILRGKPHPERRFEQTLEKPGERCCGSVR